jgi:hypothetical protein
VRSCADWKRVRDVHRSAGEAAGRAGGDSGLRTVGVGGAAAAGAKCEPEQCARARGFNASVSKHAIIDRRRSTSPTGTQSDRCDGRAWALCCL